MRCAVCGRAVAEFPRGRGILPDWIWLHEDDETPICAVPK